MKVRLDGIEHDIPRSIPENSRIKGRDIAQLLKLERGTDLYVEDDLSEDDHLVEPTELIRLKNEMRFYTLPKEPESAW